jgi:hypothetical protein
MKTGSRYFLLLVAFFTPLGCDYPELHPAPFHRISESQISFPLFYAWILSSPLSSSFGFFAVDEKGQWKRALNPPLKPLKPFGKLGGLFYPKTANARKNMDESLEFASPDRRYSIWTYSIKTFADDLDNAYLEIRDGGTGKVEKVMVPALCNGEMFPAFWHPQKHLFYFMVSVGDEKGRSLELWEYDLEARKFRNIGDTNGDAYINNDGAWVVWETGPTFRSNGSVPVSRYTLLCAYDTAQKANYQLTESQTTAFFQGWKSN